MTTSPATLEQGELTDDAFLGGALEILQPRSGYRAGLDAVMLAAAVAGEGERPLRVLDVGAGVGTAGLCLARRVLTANVVLLEREPQLAALASENASRNGLSDRVSVVTAAVGASATELRGLGLREGSFDRVIANPPYHSEGAGTPATDVLKAGAHAMPEDDLDDWARFLARMAAPGGEATIIHKAESLGAVLAAVGRRFGGLKILPLYPRLNAPAQRVLVQGTKGSRAPLQILPGLVLHGEGNAFTSSAQGILRSGDALSMAG